MQADADTPRGRRMLSKGRMEGFSDGVFGFAITLLVVDLALHPPGTPLEQGAGADPKVVERVMEHGTAAMTMDLSGHLADGNLWQAARLVGDI